MRIVDLSIIIVSFNTQQLLRDCIESVRENVSDLNYEIIVVDNASHDGSPEMIERKFADITLIRNGENAGFARANNRGIRIAHGRYVVLLNSDTLVKKKVMEALVSFMDMRPGIAAAGPTVLNVDGTLQSMGMRFPNITDAVLTVTKGERLLFWLRQMRFKHSKSERPAFRADYVSGCCIMLRSKVIEEIGGLSEDFEFYFEETEWCYRALKKGYETWCLPSVEICHLGSGSKKIESAKAYIRSEGVWYLKAGKNMKGAAATLIRLLRDLFRIVVSVAFCRRKLFEKTTALCGERLAVFRLLLTPPSR